MNKDKERILLAALAGLADPLIRQAAQKLASRVSPQNPLNSETVEAALGALKGMVEAAASRLQPPLEIAVEKATDFADFFAGALGVTQLSTEKWGDKFLENSRERLRTAADPRAELEKIKLELELLNELATLLESEAGQTTKPTATDVAEAAADASGPAVGEAIASEIQRLNEKLETLRDQVMAWARKESAK